MSLTPIMPGQIATIVTRLEMTTRPRPAPIIPSPLRLMRWNSPAPEKYRLLFRRVGEEWLWFSRLAMKDADLTAILSDPNIEIYAICDPRQIEVGLVELDFRTSDICNIAFFGLAAPLTGQGLGRALMAQTLTLGWRRTIRRITVQTCTLDHPGALAFYIKNGFRPVAQMIETFPDPRQNGLIREDAAPHIPLIKANSAL